MLNEKVRQAVAASRMAANDMIKANLQWRLDPHYIITLCDAVDALTASMPEDVKGLVERANNEAAAFEKGTEETDTGTASLLRDLATAIASLSAKVEEGRVNVLRIGDQMLAQKFRAETAEASLAERDRIIAKLREENRVLKENHEVQLSYRDEIIGSQTRIIAEKDKELARITAIADARAPAPLGRAS